MYLMRFPQGRKLALTLSYDDGSIHDRKMIEILDKHNIKCTFNINSALARNDDWHISLTEFKELCKTGGHEIACHSKTHPRLELIPPIHATEEVLEDRKNLEELTGSFVRGMAYPYGTYNDTVVQILKNSGIVYSRTVNSTNTFEIPTDWLRLNPTCHHNASNLMELADKFLSGPPAYSLPYLFYLWGHSFEFDRNDNWQILEEFCEKLGGNDQIWYATNIEIYDYVEAFKRLIFSTDGTKAYNPSAIPLYIGKGETPVEILPNETASL